MLEAKTDELNEWPSVKKWLCLWYCQPLHPEDRRSVPPKLWYCITSLYGVTTQKTSTWRRLVTRLVWMWQRSAELTLHYLTWCRGRILHLGQDTFLLPPACSVRNSVLRICTERQTSSTRRNIHSPLVGKITRHKRHKWKILASCTWSYGGESDPKELMYRMSYDTTDSACQ
jgi:hypothetical protein